MCLVTISYPSTKIFILVMRTLKIYSQHLSNIQYGIINYSHIAVHYSHIAVHYNAVHYIPMTLITGGLLTFYPSPISPNPSPLWQPAIRFC